MKMLVPILIGVVVILFGIPIVLAIVFGNEPVRDWIVIIWGLLTIMALGFFILWTIAVGTGVRRLIKQTNTVVQDDIRPIIATGRESANNATGTIRFVSDTVVHPIIRLYGIISGVRRALSVFTGMTGRGNKSEDERRR
jgi:hypothetical protein